VILFGSYAAGTATANSDLDLLIIVNSDDPSYKRSARVRSLLFPPPVSMDILVLTDEEFSRGEALGGHIVHTAIQNGKVLYAA
jgi:predicted nucleotidyltransferase